MAKVRTYNDGVAWICTEKEKAKRINAKINPVSVEDLEKHGKVHFGLLSLRSQDQEFAEKADKSLTMKIRIPTHPKLSKKHKMLIKSTLYDIFHIDLSKDKREMYVYMEEVRKLA